MGLKTIEHKTAERNLRCFVSKNAVFSELCLMTEIIGGGEILTETQSYDKINLIRRLR